MRRYPRGMNTHAQIRLGFSSPSGSAQGVIRWKFDKIRAGPIEVVGMIGK